MQIEFDRLLEKHAQETGLPVVVDFYSDSCGPCRMMAPIFKKVAAEFVDKAVFVKIDTNAQPEISSRYQIRSLPTFQYFLNGKKTHQSVGGIGEGPLRNEASSLVRQAEMENVVLTFESLKEYYAKVEGSKTEDEIENVFKKCTDMNRKVDGCVGGNANQLARKLKKKYKSAPKLDARFSEEDRKSKPKDEAKEAPTSEPKGRKTSGSSTKPNLHLATKEQLQAELDKRLDQERDEEVENESADEDEADPDFHRWEPKMFPEAMVVIGGGPAGLAAALYGARAGLTPLVLAPSMGGQLQGKGVDVENYPGLHNVTGPAVVASMRKQAAHFGAVYEDDFVVKVDASSRPLKVFTNSTGTIETHTIVLATGAESNWLGIPGEWELRGGGVSSCATCDGFLYSGKKVIVVGGGDAAMEDALVLARTSESVTVIHRRDQFRASKVLGDRVLNHPSITVRWNTTLKEIIGAPVESSEENVDLDSAPKQVNGAVLVDTASGEETLVKCDAVFVAIGHTPTTKFLDGVVDFDPEHPGYILTKTGTSTSVAGVFAAGDVADSVYRQAITSAGSGAAAALDAERYLSENGLGMEAEELEAELMAELMGDASESKESYNVYDDAGGRQQGIKESTKSEL